MIKSVKINIYGKVQDVGFRYCTVQKANEIDVKGFVKNRLDGSVYIEVEAEPELIEQFICWCRKGPSSSRIDDIRVCDIPFNHYTDFTIR